MRSALAALAGDEHVHDPADWLEDITERRMNPGRWRGT